MKAGVFVATTFFILLTVAAWTAAIGLLEPAVAWLSETRDMARPKAAMLVGIVVWLLGFLTVFSFNLLKDVHFWRGTLYANLDYLAINILLPLSGLSITLFAGWVMCRNSSAQELDSGPGSTYRLWRFLTRFVAPAGVMLLVINAALRLLHD